MSAKSNSGNGMSGRTSSGCEEGLVACDDFDFCVEGAAGFTAGGVTGGS